VVGDEAALVLGQQQGGLNWVGALGLPLRIGRASGSESDTSRSW
jgi:hypothetical protein